MTKSRLMQVILIAASALIIVGVGLLGWMSATSDEKNVMKIELEAGETESIEFESLRLVPGASCEYVIKLKEDYSDQYDLTLDFAEKEENKEKTLKKYARVRILSKEEVIYDELLATAMEAESIILPVDFKEDQNTELTVLYYLPLEVGNEAKNAEAIFELLLTASNE